MTVVSIVTIAHCNNRRRIYLEDVVERGCVVEAMQNAVRVIDCVDKAARGLLRSEVNVRKRC